MHRYVIRSAALAVAGAAGLAGEVPAAPAAPRRLPAGYYQCDQTVQSVSPVNGSVSYSTGFVGSFTLLTGGRYSVSLRGTTGHWSAAGGRLRFRGGGFDDAVNGYRVTGTYSSAGRVMPHSQLAPTRRYAVVLHGTPGDPDTAPPVRESARISFWYCRRR